MGMKVLIVEDEPELLAIMAEAFRKGGIEVFTAGNGQVGLELYRAVRPDLVITDIVMPAKEGVSLIIDIKKSPFPAPVIAISGGGARASRDYLRWAKELGATLVLQKPFRMSILLMMARFVMEKACDARLQTPSAPRPAQALAPLAKPDLGDLFDELFDEAPSLGPSLNPI